MVQKQEGYGKDKKLLVFDTGRRMNVLYLGRGVQCGSKSQVYLAL